MMSPYMEQLVESWVRRDVDAFGCKRQNPEL